jgi:hypothetical protein
MTLLTVKVLLTVKEKESEQLFSRQCLSAAYTEQGLMALESPSFSASMWALDFRLERIDQSLYDLIRTNQLTQREIEVARDRVGGQNTAITGPTIDELRREIREYMRDSEGKSEKWKREKLVLMYVWVDANERWLRNFANNTDLVFQRRRAARNGRF